MSTTIARYRTIQEAADRFNCCTTTVRRLAIRGVLRGTKVGNRWRFTDEDLEAYLARDDDEELVQQIVDVAPTLSPGQVHRLVALCDYTPH